MHNSFSSVNDAVPPRGGRFFFAGSAEPQLGILLHAIGILHRLTQENSEKNVYSERYVITL